VVQEQPSSLYRQSAIDGAETGTQAMGIPAERMFGLISALQRFICATANVSLSAVAQNSTQLLLDFPRARNPAENMLLRASCFDLALRWREREHKAVTQFCSYAPCPLTSMEDARRFWNENAGDCISIMAEWLRYTCEELMKTHQTVGQRAGDLVRARFKHPLNVANLCKSEPVRNFVCGA
jgi:hypothetical protein